jgi:hypothetical protein
MGLLVLTLPTRPIRLREKREHSIAADDFEEDVSRSKADRVGSIRQEGCGEKLLMNTKSTALHYSLNPREVQAHIWSSIAMGGIMQVNARMVWRCLEGVYIGVKG